MLNPSEFSEPMELRPTAELLVRHWWDGEFTFVRNFENAVYRLPTTPRASYLRLTPGAHHSSDEVRAELDFARFLGSRGLPVAQPIPDRSGQLVNTASAGGGWTAAVFEEAPGRRYDEYPDLDHGAFFFNAGRLMAEVHTAGAEYREDLGALRFHWRDDRWNRFPELVPHRETSAWELYDELMTWTTMLPTDAGHYGPIHGDFTIANLRLDEGAVNLFDLDSCCAHWHAYEVAMFLHFFGARPTLRDLAYDRVLEGYATVRPTDPAFLAQIPQFGKMRLLYSFLVFATEWGFDHLSPEQEAYFHVRRSLFVGDPLWPSSRRAQ